MLDVQGLAEPCILYDHRPPNNLIVQQASLDLEAAEGKLWPASHALLEAREEKITYPSDRVSN